MEQTTGTSGGDGTRVRRAFFLDRDGVINVHRDDYVKSVEEFVLLPDAPRAIRLLNENGWLVVVVTNQSAVGKGIITEDRLREIHAHMLSLLEKEGARVDAIYYCPHRPDDGCPCRKPEPGMLLRAARDLGIDLSRSVMVGDMDTDIEAGKRAGTWKQIRVGDGKNLLDAVMEVLGECEGC